MGALNGPLKPKRSTISGEVPSPGDLQNGELAANTADGKLFVKHTDGTIKTIAGDLDNFATVATTGDYADLINAPVPVTASNGALLQYRTGEGYAEKTISQILNGSTAGIQVNSVTFTMAGTDGFYVDQAAMLADGFTDFGGVNQDDTSIDFSSLVPANFKTVDYLGLGLPDSYTLSNWELNANGAVYIDDANLNITQKNGNYITDSASTLLYVSFWSQDTESRMSGIKQVNSVDGTNWFVVRTDQKIPYNSDTNGCAVEVWFGLDGRIRVSYGTAVNSAPITSGATRIGIASEGSDVISGSAEWVAAGGTAGGITLEYSTEVAVVGANLNDLSNVSTIPPTDGQVLAYDNAASIWVPSTPFSGDYNDLTNQPAIPTVDVTEAPQDGSEYVRKDGAWAVATGGGGGGASAIDDLSDVDTSTTPPTNGQALIWDNAASEWKPGSVAAGDLSTASVGDFSDVDLSPQPASKLIDFETVASSLKDPLPTVASPGFRQTGTTFAGSYAYLVNNVAYGDGSKFENGLERTSSQYDIVSLHIRSAAALDTSNRVSLGGNKSSISAGGGWTIYTRNTGFGFYAENGFVEIGTRPTLAADTWYHVIYVLNWENGRSILPAVSMWIDGSQVINNVTPSIAYQFTPGQDLDFHLANSGTGSGQTKYWDNIRILQYDSIDWAMTDASLNMSDAITWIDAQTRPASYNDVLRWNGSKFVPTGANTSAVPIFKGLSDVTIVENENGDYEATIQGLDAITFDSQDYISGRTSSDDSWGFYSNSAYGMVFGEWTSSGNGARLYCAPDHGILLGSGRTGVTYLARDVTPDVNGSQEPELRWHTGGPVNDSGNYVGIKVSNTISSDYTYTLPVADGTSGQVLSTNGSGVTSWIDVVDSVNGETGAVSLGIQDMNDFELYLTAGSGYPYQWRSTSDNGFPVNGEAGPGLGWDLSLGDLDDDGNSTVSDFQRLIDQNATEITLSSGQSTDTFSITDINNSGHTMVLDQAGKDFLNGLSDGDILLINSALFTGGPGQSEIALTEGDILQWDNTESKFKPAQLPAAPDTATTWQLTANGSTDYIFTGPGLDGVNDPTIYLMRGQTYKFVNEMNAHPFRIQQVGGASYSSGITNNDVSNGTLTFEVPMDAPATLEYVCTSHAAMTGTIHILTEDSISLATLKAEVAAATDFADFQSRIAAL